MRARTVKVDYPGIIEMRSFLKCCEENEYAYFRAGKNATHEDTVLVLVNGNTTGAIGWFSVDSTFKGEAIKVADFEQHRPKGHPLTIDAGSKYYKITGGKCENISRDEIILVSSGISLNSRQWRANMLVEF